MQRVGFHISLMMAAVGSAAAFLPSGVAPALRARGPAAAAAAGQRLQRGGLRMMAGGAESKFAKLMADCKDWGLCRFITINPSGAVLETASPMDVGLKFFDIPGKVCAYAARTCDALRNWLDIGEPPSSDKLFECHIRLEAAAQVTFAKEAAKMGGHDLFVMRIKDKEGAILLSCMLQYDPAKGPGNYFDGAVAKFEAVQNKWGAAASLS